MMTITKRKNSIGETLYEITTLVGGVVVMTAVVAGSACLAWTAVKIAVAIIAGLLSVAGPFLLMIVVAAAILAALTGGNKLLK